jgi:hypothetical protein
MNAKETYYSGIPEGCVYNRGLVLLPRKAVGLVKAAVDVGLAAEDHPDHRFAGGGYMHVI